MPAKIDKAIKQLEDMIKLNKELLKKSRAFLAETEALLKAIRKETKQGKDC